MASLFKASDSKTHDDFDDFNFDDFNFDVPEPKDNRHPIVKALAPIARGSKDYITNPSNIEKFVKAAMPKGYGQAYDLFQEGKSEMKQLYHSVGEEIKPTKDAAKSLFRKTLPALDGKIPKGLQKKLEELTKEEKQWQSSQGDQREQQMGSLLESIFQQKATDEVRNREETNTREKIREGFEQIRHRDSMSQLDAIRVAVQQQAAYTNKIQYAVQKKQLELQYRMFWAMADLNKEQKKSNAMLLTNLKAITINTGIPDFAKIGVHESFKQIMRNKFLENAREGMFGGAKDYFNKFARNIKDQVTSRVRDYVSPLEALGSSADGMADTMQGMEGIPGFSAKDEMIAQGMSLPLDWVSNRASQMLAKRLAKNRKLRRGGVKAEHFVNTFGDRVHEQLTRSDKSWGGLEGIREFLASAAPSKLPDSKMEVDRLDRMHEPKPFSRSNSKSIDEIIPGLLARIHREIKILRTGDENTPLTTYDYTKNKFSNEKQQKADLRKLIAGNSTKNANTHAQKIIDKIDRGGKLTAEQREKLRQQLIKRAVNGENVDISQSHMAHQWGGGDDGMAIAGAFNRYLRADGGKLSNNEQAYKRQIELLQDHRSIVGGIGDPRVLLQSLTNQGQLQQLKDMGILDASNTVNRELYSDWLMNPDNSGAAGAPAPAGGGASLRGLRSNQPGKFRKRATQPGGLSSLAAPAGTHASQDVSADLKALTDALNSRQAAGSTVEKNVQSIADLLEGLDAKYMHATDSNHAVLGAMLQQLQIIATGGVGSVGSSSLGGGTGGFVGPMQPAPRAYTSLWDHIKGVGGEQASRAKDAGKRAASKAHGIWSKYAPKVGQRVGDVWGKGKNLAGNTAGRLKDYYGDVVVSGEVFPRLRAQLLKAGEYRDKATGRIITSLDEITGDVVDSSGNLVITLDEFYDSYITGSINKKVRDLFGNLKNKVADSYHRLANWMPGKVAALKNLVMGGVERVRNMLPPYDVYVKNDMKRPLLYANLMKFNEYYSVKTDKVLTHPRFIDGPVRDSKGNIVVSEDHLKVGLCDVQGDPVGGVRWPIKTFRKAQAVWEQLKNATAGIFGAIGKGLGNASEYFKNFFTPFADMITNSKKTVTLLEEIRDLLDARMPGKKVRGDSDGDGVRDGSLEDQHRHKAKEKEEKEHEEAAAGGGGKNGVMSKLIASIGGLFGKKKKDEEEHEDHEDHESLLDEVHDAADIYDDVRGNGSGRGDKGSKARRKAALKRLKRMKAAKAKPGFLRRLAGRGGRLGRFARAGMFNTRGVRAAGGVAGGVGSAALRGAGAVGGAGLRGVGGLGRWATGGSKLAKLARWGMFNTDIVGGAAKGIGFLGRNAGMLGRGLGLAGTAMSAYSMVNNLSQGNYGAAAGDAAMGVGGLAVSGLGVGGTLSALGGGLATVLASPFLLPALGAAAVVGGVGLMGYAAYKYMKKTKLTNLSKLRLAQYGFSSDDSDSMAKIFQLEQTLEPLVTIKEDGNMYLDEKKLDLKGIAESFDIHAQKDMELFNMWYRRRFVPVYRTWMQEMRKRAPDGKIAKIEDAIPGKEKLQVATSAVEKNVDAYSHMVGWNMNQLHLAYDYDGVKGMLDSMRMDLEKERESDGGEKAKAEQQDGAPTTRSAAGLAALALKDSGRYEAKDKDGKSIDVTGMDVGDLTEKIKKGDITVSVAVALPPSLVHTEKNRLDALASIRYKAYGLKYMSADKVRMLGALELFMGDHLTDDGDNPKLTMDTNQVMKAAADVFGVPNMTGEHAQRWKVWFNGRFLPVFLLWAGAMRKKTGKTKLMEASDAFKIADQLTTARAIIGAQGMDASGSRTSIWNISSNPFSDADFEMNTDADSTASNLEALRLLADKVRLGEVSANTKVDSSGAASKGLLKSLQDGYKSDGFIGALKAGKDSVFGGHNAATQANGETVLDKDAKPMSGMGDPVKMSGEGGGNYAALPKSNGKGWAANKDLIIAAAKMAGIDPKALITTIAIESGFDPDAGAGTSSAKGFGQFIDSTWLSTLQSYGRKFGIPNGTAQNDPRANALMTAMYLKDNASQLQKSIGRAPTMTDLYLSHFLGPQGAKDFLKAPDAAIAAELFPKAARANKNIFYDGARALSVKEIYSKLANMVAKKPAQFNIAESDMRGSDSGQTTGAPSSTSGSTAASPPAAGAAEQTAQTGPAPRGSGGFQPTTSANGTPTAGSASLSTPVVMEDGKSATMGTGPAIVKNPNAKYELILQREASEDDGTYGTLRLPDGTTLNTLELPWMNNDPQKSCIPPGSYKCKKRPSEHFGAAYEVQGVQGRSAILIHAGNAAGSVDKGMKADSKGCILLGMDRGRQGNQKVITASKAAMKLFYDKMQDQDFTLVIRPGKGGLGTGDAKSGVSFDPVRGSNPSTAATPATPQAGSASFTPQGPRGNAGVAPAASSDLPRYNSTVTGINPGAPTQADMQGRDAAMSDAVAPKLDNMVNTLLKSLDVQTGSLSVLKQILAVVQGGGGNAAPSDDKMKLENRKVKPVSDVNVPVPQRRSTM
jgi:hypothetical protein